MTRTRHPLWERRVADYLGSAALRRHKYGEHDCMLHSAAIVEAVTGVDVGAMHRGKYDSRPGAVRHLLSIGFKSPEEMIDSLLDEVPVGFAQRGDVVLTPANADGEWRIPGGCVGGVALCLLPTGLVAEPRKRWIKAWKVGR